MVTPPQHRFPWLPLLYLGFGIAWILASDSVMMRVFGSAPHLLLIASTVKGFAFVALTALMLVFWWNAERRRTQALLQGAEARAGFASERLAWMVRHANDVILLLDLDGKIVDCNQRAESTYGYTRDELLRLDVFALRARRETGEHGRPGDTGRHARTVMEHGIVFSAVHQRKDRSTFPVQVSSTRVEFQGRPYVQSIVRDQSELDAARRRIERQRDLYDMLSRCNHAASRLQNRQALFKDVVRLAVEHGHFLFACIAEVQADGSVAKVAMHGTYGGYLDRLSLSVNPDEPDGRGPVGICLREGTTVVCNRFLDDPRTAAWHPLGRIVGVRGSATIPVRLRGATIGALMVYASEPDFFEADIVETLEEVAAEIQFGLEALQTRTELEESRNLLQSVINASAAPMYAYDRNGRALLMNEACARLIKGTPTGLVGQPRAEQVPHRIESSHRAADLRVFETGTTVVTEETIGSGATERVFLSVKYPLRDLHGTIYAVGGVSTEITDLRRAQREVSEANARLEQTVDQRTRELVAARDRAEQADRSKTAFLSTISHELRTPLNSIIGFTDILLQQLSGPVNQEQRRQLVIVQESSRLLLGLINEILDLSRIEAGRLQLHLEPFDLAALLRQRVSAFASFAADKQLTLEVHIDPAVGPVVSDPRRVAQIVTNLLSNALKFTAHGGVSLHARPVAQAVEIEVRDSGPGIAPEDLSQLFKPFVQLGDAQRTHHEGTGLGLVISRHLARALGGDVRVSSAVGEGTAFTVTLPVCSSAQAAEHDDTGLLRRIAAAPA